ncbi:MAG: hypothetical protein IJV41_11710 [Oscillospiraceae bacterium]|nr:hypothetical protein [Oscillospiraceae bacterium]
MRKLILILLLIPWFVTPAYADFPYEQAAEEFGTGAMEQGLTEGERSVTGSLQLDGRYDVDGALHRLVKALIENVKSEIRRNIRFSAELIVLVFLCALVVIGTEGHKAGQFAEICCVCTAAGILVGSFDSIVSQTTEAMYRLSDYSKAALPVVFTAAAASGAVSSAGVRFAAASFAMDVLMSLSQSLIIPCIFAYLAIVLANSLFPNQLLAAVGKFIKWTATTLMTGMTLAFTAYIQITGLVSSSVDAAAVKTTRTVLSGVLPVVGGILSDASAAVLSAAGVVRSCAGAFGLIVVCVICVGPFAMLSVKTLLFKMVSRIADSVQIDRLSGLLSGVGNAIAMLLGLLGSCGIMLFIALTAGMKAVSG